MELDFLLYISDKKIFTFIAYFEGEKKKLIKDTKKRNFGQLSLGVSK